MGFPRLPVCLALLLIGCSQLLHAARLPRYLLQLGDSYALVVDKKNQVLSLYQGGAGGPRLVRDYRCTTGKNNNGSKHVAGDKKTPNGIYFFRGMIEDGQLPAKYGVRAFPMDYPNDWDRLQDKTGYGIWLHAVEDDHRVAVSYDTEGCVVVTNHDILELTRYIEFEATPIIVDDSVQTFEERELTAERNQALDFVTTWAEAWQGKDLDTYIDCYDDRFTIGGRDKAAYRTYKQQLNRAYQTIRVELSDIRVFRFHDYLVVSFFQDYRSSGLQSNGRKRLYLTRTPGGLKILAERFQRS